jgi:hypothetical protein
MGESLARQHDASCAFLYWELWLRLPTSETLQRAGRATQVARDWERPDPLRLRSSACVVSLSPKLQHREK